MSSRQVIVVVPQDTVFGTIRFSPATLSNIIMGKLMNQGRQVDVIGIGPASPLVVAGVNMTHDAIKSHVHGVNLSANLAPQQDGIGIDIRRGAGEDITAQVTEFPHPYVAATLRSTPESLIGRVCRCLGDFETVHLLGAASTIHKVIRAAVSIRSVSRIEAGISNVTIGTIRTDFRKSAQLVVVIKKGASKSYEDGMRDFFTPWSETINSALLNGRSAL